MARPTSRRSPSQPDSPVAYVVALSRPGVASGKATRMVSMQPRPSQRGWNRSRAGPRVHCLSGCAVIHHHTARIARQPLGRFRGKRVCPRPRPLDPAGPGPRERWRRREPPPDIARPAPPGRGDGAAPPLPTSRARRLVAGRGSPTPRPAPNREAGCAAAGRASLEPPRARAAAPHRPRGSAVPGPPPSHPRPRRHAALAIRAAWPPLTLASAVEPAPAPYDPLHLGRGPRPRARRRLWVSGVATRVRARTLA